MFETVCYKGFSVNDRVFPICSLEIEFEEHVLIRCPAYNNYRDALWSTAFNLNHYFNIMNDRENVFDT